MSAIRFLIIFLFFAVWFFIPQSAFANTTPYRSAGWVGTNTSYSNPYTNLTGCQATDGVYCEHPSAPGGMNLYFSSFGTMADFGIPQGSMINKVHFRVTGKNNVTQWIQVDEHRNQPLGNLCQSPFDLWQVYLGPNDTVKELHTTFTSSNFLFSCFSPARVDAQNFTVALFFNGYYVSNWYAYIDNFEIAFDYTPAPTPTPTNIPTPTPTVTPTPTPTPPPPFLDLPWDYENTRSNPKRKPLTFEEAAFAINSYFDHEYPLLSSGLGEPFQPSSISATIISYFGFPRRFTAEGYYYSSHDGYDYGTPAQVEDGDPVFAAYAGMATLVKEANSGGGGNVIKISHGNGYQTIYEHLYYDDNLIVKNEGEEKHVAAGERIGTVGHTGNCWVPDGHGGKIYNTPDCAHIHFGVVQDKDHDGNFDNNIPDGLTDPYGWQSTDPDPWENYSFFYDGKQRTGNKSYYLWIKQIPNLKEGLPSNGGVFHIGACTVSFPDDPTRPYLNLEMQSSPYDKISESIVGIVPTVQITTKNLLGDFVKFFSGYITIKIEFNDVDLSHYDLGTTTFSIYSSDDKGNWIKEPTVIDLTGKTATTQVNHLTYFALMAERKDTIAPVTTALLQGDQGQDNWYRSDVQLELNAQDNDGGLGVNHTWYKIEGEDWQTYTTPLIFTNAGHHQVEYYSVDRDDNIEGVKTVAFDIDKTLPEAKIQFDTSLEDLKITGIDNSGETTVTRTDISTNEEKVDVVDKAGNKLTIQDIDRVHGPNAVMLIKSLDYNGNTTIPDANKLSIRYQIDKASLVKTLEQKFEIKGVVKVLLSYDSKINKTEITENGLKTIVDGIKILQLSTNRGTLEYSY